MQGSSPLATFLFTDIEGSTRLWEQQPELMRPALAHHDSILRAAVESNRGMVAKTTGDGVVAVFADPLDAVAAAAQIQRALANLTATGAVPIAARCGMHTGVAERRDNDFFGVAVNRAARIMGAAHGGQVLLSHAAWTLVSDRLPEDAGLLDLGLVRLRGLSGPEHVYQLTLPDLRNDFPPLRSLATTPNNLPLQMTSFIGRAREVVEIVASLGKTRLLTLCGTGGIGKTRLSLQVAAGVIDGYPDGAWFVELAPVTDGPMVAQAVASVLAVKEAAGHPVVEALVKYVRDKKLLLILDNCEHLRDACADLVKQLLQAGPHLKVLASSREPLQLAGETTHPVATLATPKPGAVATPQVLSQYESVRLFIDRALAVQPGFSMTDENATAVAQICHHLDGIALAIELAAARVRSLSVGQIAARLDDRFRLLAGSDRTLLPRQQTLRALIDWSFDLLSDDERALFRRLSVFAGGFTLEAAEAVGAGEEIEAAQVLDLLANLVDKSLVAMEAEGERYRFLETMRQYAQERLAQSHEGDPVRTRHFRYYLALAETARPKLSGPEQEKWFSRLDQERENILASHAWCERTEEGADAGVRLAYFVKPYWFNRGLLNLGHRVTVEALARIGAQDRTLTRSRVLADAGQFCSFMGRYQEAQRYLEESLDIARAIENKGMVARVLQVLGMALLGQGDLPTARGYLEEGLVLADKQGDKREIAAASNALAQLHRVDGELDKAEPMFGRVLMLARELGDREVIAVGLLNLAMVAVSRGARDRARSMLLEALAIATEIGSRPAGQSVLEVCAGLAAFHAEWERAVRFFGMAEAHMEYTGIHRDAADTAFLEPLMAKARDELDAAAVAAADSAGRGLSYDEGISEARRWLEDP